MTDTDIRAAAVSRWETELAAMPAGAEWFDDVADRIIELGLFAHGQPTVKVARPHLVTEAMLAEDQRRVDAVLACLIAAGDAVTQDPDLGNRYLGTWVSDQPAADLFLLPSGYDYPIAMGRLDGARLDDGLHFLEFNGGLPGGAQSSDVASALLAEWPCAHGFARSWPFRRLDAGAGIINAYVDSWHSFGGTGSPFVVVGLPDELREGLGDLVTGTLNYLTSRADELGVEVAVVDPGQLTHHDRRLRLADRPVDVFMRGYFTTMMTYLGDRLTGVHSALRAGDLCMVNSMRSGLYGHKGLFAVVTDPDTAVELPAAHVELARAVLPWTRMMKPGATTTPDGSRVDLLEYLRAHRDQVVVKPTTGYGGSGVELGWNHTDESWRAVIDAAIAQGTFIVQERVPISRGSYPLLQPGFPHADFTGDVNPFVTLGRISGYMVRLTAGDGVTNFSSGGSSLTGTFVLTDTDAC